MDINGLEIVLKNITHIDRIKMIKGDNAHDLLRYNLMPEQTVYGFQIHFMGNTKPLVLMDEKQSVMEKTRAEIIAEINRL